MGEGKDKYVVGRRMCYVFQYILAIVHCIMIYVTYRDWLL